MSDDELWAEAEKKTERELGPYPDANFAETMAMGVVGVLSGMVLIGFNVPSVLVAPALGVLVAGGHYAWRALGRWEHHRRFARNLDEAKRFARRTGRLDDSGSNTRLE